jgi:hypothetical protein
MRKFLLATMMLAAMAAVAQQQPTAAQMARSSRQQAGSPSRTPKVYDNDNLPTQAPITVLGSVSAPEAATADARPEDNSSSAAATNDPKQKKDDAEAARKRQEEWRSKLADQRKEIGTLQRELDILQRENRLRQAAVYSDAGNSLRDPAKWAAEDRQYQQQITEKSQQLDKAKTKLEDLLEQARKAGIPASVTQ